MGYDEAEELAEVRRQGFGVFDGQMRQQEQVDVQPDASGVTLRYTCQGCGLGTSVLVEWPELVALKYYVNPARAFHGHARIVQEPLACEWSPDQHAWKVLADCPNGGCGFHAGLRIQPDEPERWLALGRRRGWINPAGEQQVSQHCQQLAMALRPGR